MISTFLWIVFWISLMNPSIRICFTCCVDMICSELPLKTKSFDVTIMSLSSRFIVISIQYSLHLQYTTKADYYAPGALVSPTECLPFDHITNETSTTLQIVQVGWIKIMSCQEASPQFMNYSTDYDPFTIYRDDYLSLATHAVTIKFQPPGGTINPNYDDLTVLTYVYASQIFGGLNYDQEVSYLYDINGNRIGLGNSPNWIGTEWAKKRLDKDCYSPGSPRTIDKVLFDACENPYGIQIFPMRDNISVSKCLWEQSRILGSDMEIYFGYRAECYYKVTTTTTTKKPTGMQLRYTV